MLKQLFRPWKSRRNPTDAVEPWALSTPLVSFSKHDCLTIGRALEGVAIMGAIGSGKSTGSGRTLALAFLAAGFGFLVLCAKSDDAIQFSLAKAVGPDGKGLDRPRMRH